ncbi:hypothetical protein [Chitinimonas naiadis]
MPLRPFIATLLLAAAAQAETFSFGLWGDMPYAKSGDEPRMQALVDSMNRSDIAFSIYDGDIKDGSSLCTDEMFDKALNLFNQFRKPVIYVPGDNEWTDCHRSNNGGYDNLERLARLRKLMYPTLTSLGRTTLALEHQGKLGEPYVENVRFIHKGVLFVGLNIPGSNNNLVPDSKECSHKSARTPNQCEADNAEYRERDAANASWLQSAFQLARDRKLKGLVVVMQADPGFDLPETEDVDESQLPQYQGYKAFISQLVAQTEQYAGQVLLVHGDTHYFKVDKPLYSPQKTLPNFTRVETFGSPLIHWVKVKVDTRDEAVFTIRPGMVQH